MRIVLCYPLKDRHLKQITDAAPDAEIVNAGQERIAQELPSADIFCGHAKVPVPWDDVVAAGRLRWIQSSAAGLDHCLTPPVVGCDDIMVTGASGLFADPVAEQTMALMMCLVRSQNVFFHAGLKKEFIRRPTRDLHDATVGIVGFGGNGRRIAEVLAPFRTRILATDICKRDRPDHVEAIWPAERLDDLLAQSDIVILCVPLTPETTGMINAKTIGQMKEGALLINVARGPCIAEADMAAALAGGRLGGAGVDVTEVEPLPESSPLWNEPNAVISPHVGAQSAVRLDRTTDRFVANLERYCNNQPMIDVVDKSRGFSVRDGV